MASVAVDTTPIPELFRVPSAAPDLTPAVPTARPKYEPPNRKLEDVRISSNAGPMKPENLGWLQPVDPKTTSMDEMRELFIEQGYIWVKGLIPREDTLAFRRKYFEFMAPTGVIKEGTDPVDGIYCGADPEQFLPPRNGRECENTDQAEQFIKRNIEAHHSKWLEEITTHPVLFKFVKDFTNWPSIKLLKRQMLRANVPGAETTAVHYDHIFLRYGPPTFLTGWLPFGDIAVEGGGLTYLEDAVPLAQAIENDFSKRAEKFTPEERLNAFNANMMRDGHLGHDSQGFSTTHGNRKWLIANYEAGDVVFHHPFSIHASCLNQSPTNTIRLATDLRFVNPEAPYDTRWTNYWSPTDGL
ncbi:hypothetical protein RSOLAG22IIIB_04813 [Rhizoctonia solani]|uniref:Phytanoyl-CoA hydroxylase n=1 Tax=Rhizoctonia solani TaxID=456999 RepID=A0A0K6G0W3_9AGAM|nr:hypothetical protein RSOLAG22IIIB_04813 [Rhizoctonia solani]